MHKVVSLLLNSKQTQCMADRVCLFRKSLHPFKCQIQEMPKFSISHWNCGILGFLEKTEARGLKPLSGLRWGAQFPLEAFSPLGMIFCVFFYQNALYFWKARSPLSLSLAVSRVVRFPKLPNQAEQLVPKETGGGLPCRMNGFQGNGSESPAQSRETFQNLVWCWPSCLVFWGVICICWCSNKRPFHGANPWNSFVPTMSPYHQSDDIAQN